MLEQLRREQEDMLGQLQHHLEASKEVVRELEQNMRVLEQAHTATETSVLAEVISGFCGYNPSFFEIFVCLVVLVFVVSCRDQSWQRSQL